MITTGRGAYEIRSENTGRHNSRTTRVGEWMGRHRRVTIAGLSAASIATVGLGGVALGGLGL